jgi:hypothetical protein
MTQQEIVDSKTNGPVPLESEPLSPIERYRFAVDNYVRCIEERATHTPVFFDWVKKVKESEKARLYHANR